MNNQEIISEGYLEAYITEDLTPEENQSVENRLNEPEVRDEFLRVQSTIEGLAFRASVYPDKKVKTHIFNQISNRGKKPSWVLAASITLALLSLGAAIFFYTKYKSVQDQLAEVSTQNEKLTGDVQKVNQQMIDIKADLNVLIDPAFTRVVLQSTVDDAQHKAVIYFNSSEEEVYLNTSSLPELSENQQYQLWALIDGKPVNAGVFDTLKDEFQKMESFESVDAFAVTIEPRGGSQNPTLEQMQVYGEVKKS